jgi:hypothetical protein
MGKEIEPPKNCELPGGVCPAYPIALKMDEADIMANIFLANTHQAREDPEVSQNLVDRYRQAFQKQKDEATKMENKLIALRRDGKLCDNCSW